MSMMPQLTAVVHGTYIEGIEVRRRGHTNTSRYLINNFTLLKKPLYCQDLQKTIIKNENIEGTAYKVYELNGQNKGFQLITYINSRQGDLERVYLSGKKDGLDLAIQEEIMNQNVPESVPVDTFGFFPPDSIKQVTKPITIEPF